MIRIDGVIRHFTSGLKKWVILCVPREANHRINICESCVNSLPELLRILVISLYYLPGTSDDMDISLLFLQIQPGAITKNEISRKWIGISKSFFHRIKIWDI